MKNLPFLILFAILINIASIQAINLDITSKPISNSFIIELNEPAIFDLTIRNLEKDESFEIYSLVGIDITPKEPFEIKSGETRTIRIKLMPQESLKVKRESSFTFEYKIKNSKNEIQKETLSINIVNLGSSLSIIPESIHPNSEKILITVKNNLFFNFKKIDIKITSAFFEYEQAISLKPKEKKELIVQIDKEKLKKLNAGNYLVNSQITVKGKTDSTESQIKFLEKEGIETSESEEGFLIQRTEIIKKNTGNIRKKIKITVSKNILSYLFTTTNIPPTTTKTKDSLRVYTWEKELIPNEELKIIIKTNWFFPIILIIIIIFAIRLIRRSLYTDLELLKKVSFIKTKGGQFALRITIKVKAKRFVERINIIDKLPPLVELYQKFGLIEPNKIDLDNKRLEWNLPSLNKDESRILTYIIYSKIGVVGRFELPEAKAIYEKEGKIKEVSSNRSFYINEPEE